MPNLDRYEALYVDKENKKWETSIKKFHFITLFWELYVYLQIFLHILTAFMWSKKKLFYDARLKLLSLI